MADNGVKLLALRCAGYNNVDLTATVGRMKVVRVPAYSPYAVAEFTVVIDAFAQSQDTSCNDAHPRWKLFIAWVDGI